MRLIKLELSGFKSFAKKTEIKFDRGITAIVGPNGSGKSNIADSIRWVLGEQSAKTLRGNKMEDVIFGGTASRKPMSYCEVTLTFDNSDGQLPIDYTEVAITRRVYRSGDSEYCINGKSCRLKDINELFRDTGLGKEGYSIVGQGKVEEILSNKSGERRKAFEEAAGIMKYRVRKEEAERNLNNTRNNLIRLNDLLMDVEDRLEPLRNQSEHAEEFLRLRDELREVEVSLFLHQYDKITERISSIDSTIAQIDEELSETEKIQAEASAVCEEKEAHERKIGDELAELNNSLIAMTAGLEQSIGQIKVLEERLANADRETERLRIHRDESIARRDDLTERISGHDSSSVEREEILNALRSDFSAKRNEIIEVNTLVEELEQKIEQLKNSIYDAMNSIMDAKSKITHFTTLKSSYEAKLKEVEQAAASIDDDERELKEELEAEARILSDIEDKHKRTTDAISAAVELSNNKKFELSKLNSEIRQKEQLFEGKRSRLSTLMDMKKAHDGYYQSVRRVLQDRERDVNLQHDIEGVVAEIIRVPADYETALEMALGNTLQNIVTPDEGAAKRVIEHLRRNNYGRATLLPITAIRSRTLNRDERALLSRPGCIGVASELIDYEPRYKQIVENLLGRTIIVEDLDVGVSIGRASNHSVRVATLAGDIINPGGSMTGGSVAKNSVSLLGRERECADLFAQIDAMKKELASMREQAKELEQSSELATKKVSELIEAKHGVEVNLEKQKEKYSIIEQQLSGVSDKRSQFDSDRERIIDSMNDIDEQCKAAENAQHELTEGREATQEDIKKAQGELSVLKTRQSKVGDEFTDLKVRIATLEKEGDTLENEKKRLNAELSSAIASIEYDEKSIAKYSDERAQLIEEKTRIEEKIASERSTNTAASDEQKRLESERNAIIEVLNEARRKKSESDDLISELRERKHRQELNRNKSEVELAGMQDRIWSEYELTYENAQAYRRPIAATSAHQRTDELKRAIKALGDININAIEDYKELYARYTSMKAQYDDLQNAESDLMELIGKLISTMETSFRDKFEQIRQNFLKVFVELFGGGTADLILSDAEDILNCDIAILAQIPGKKLQSLAPLSGGERALTAIALQFAILGLKPTAFCLLDEIDASLDEANVSRFANYIHSYAENTQFILITHRKGSMEACNALYGVAQEEKGVSKVVSARINQVE